MGVVRRVKPVAVKEIEGIFQSGKTYTKYKRDSTLTNILRRVSL